jgi:hypothetical protein
MTETETERAALSRTEWILLAVGALVAFLVHTHFRMTGFGEQDAGRLASDAINWHFVGSIDMAKVDYRLHTSPLYIHALKSLLDHGLAIRALPRWMNGASVFLSSACLAGLYVLFRRLSTPAIAAAAVVLYSLTPCFWLGSVYGMPTLPSLTFLVFAALSFAGAADCAAFDPRYLRRPRFLGFIALSTVLATIAFSLKADMALSSGALLTVLMARGRFKPLLLGFIVLIVGIGTAFTVMYAHHLSVPVVVVEPKDPHAVSGFLSSWNGRFPFQWSLLVDPKNNAPISHAAGTLLFAVCLLALLRGLVSEKPRLWQTLGAAVWGLPPMLFWGLKTGNSARHNLPALPPLVFLAAVMLFRLANDNLRRGWVLVVLVFALGQMDYSGYGSVTPRADVLAATEQVERSTSSLHRRARDFMSSPSPKKALVETEYLLPYSEFEAWAAARTPALRARPKAVLDRAEDGTLRETRLVLVGNARAAKSQAQSLRSQGFDVFSLQFSL